MIGDTELEWSKEATDILIEAVEHDMKRYDDDSGMYANLMSLHKNKMNHFAKKGRYKDQSEFIEGLKEYRDSFADIQDSNLVY
jgi:hypothetical protein